MSVKRLIAACLASAAAPGVAAPVTMVKTATTVSDPLNNLFPMAIPGAIIEYKIALTGGTAGAVAPEITDAVPTGMTFCLANFDLVIPGPVLFADTSFLLSSGIAFSFSGLNNAGDGLEFSSSTSDTDFTYQPSGTGCDTQIKRIRIKFAGTFGAGKTANVRFRMMVK